MSKAKFILGIETSCDETSAAIVQKEENGVKILSNIVASSADLQAKYGGVIPEQAAREQLKSIIPVLQEALNKASIKPDELDAIAVTQGPGLIGSLLVGAETAKALAMVWKKPLIPVNHLLGHFYANWISNNPPTFPILGLLVSGGHTDLVLFENHGKYKYVGGTRDDAAGECFDKCARLLNLPYPGGPQISKAAESGDSKIFKLPRPMLDSEDFDFSFSGLKTAVANTVNNLPHKLDSKIINNLAASVEEAITDVLVTKTIKAAEKLQVNQIMLAGGVAANRTLAERIPLTAKRKIPHVEIYIPPTDLCTDNAAYIAATAFYNYHPIDPLTLQANPNLSLSSYNQT